MTLGSSLRAILRKTIPDKQRTQLSRAWLHTVASRKSDNLIELAQFFGTDKWGLHWYAQHYQRHFQHLRHKKMVVMEIGIGGYENAYAGGESLRTWKYFFPNSLIVGIDLHEKRIHEDRIRVFQGSQADEAFLRRVVAEVGRPDIVIDDGSHLNAHILESFRVLFPLLQDDGIYVAEDLQTSYWPTWGGAERDYNRTDTAMGYFKSLVDGLNHCEYVIPGYQPTYHDLNIVAMHFYHSMAFMQKGANNEVSNMVKAGILYETSDEIQR